MFELEKKKEKKFNFYLFNILYATTPSKLNAAPTKEPITPNPGEKKVQKFIVIPKPDAVVRTAVITIHIIGAIMAIKPIKNQITTISVVSLSPLYTLYEENIIRRPLISINMLHMIPTIVIIENSVPVENAIGIDTPHIHI